MLYVLFYERTPGVLRACKGTTDLSAALDAGKLYAAAYGYAEIELREGGVKLVIWREGVRATQPPASVVVHAPDSLPVDPALAPAAPNPPEPTSDLAPLPGYALDTLR